MNLLELTRRAAIAPPAHVFVHTVANPFRPHERVDGRALWRDGLTARELLPEGWTTELARLVVNGEPAQDEWDLPLVAGAHVLVIRLFGGLGDAVGDYFEALGGFYKKLFYGGQGYLADIYRNVTQLFAPELPGRGFNSNSSPVYGWGRLSTNYNPAGMPKPVQYGEHRNGGAVISQWVDIVDGQTPESFLNLLLVLSSGPIQSIGQYETDQDNLTGAALPDSLLIEDNDAKNYDGITCSLRLGSLTQEPIAGVSDTRTQYTVDLPIDQEPVGTPPVVDWSMAAAFDMPTGTLADRARIGLAFPEGMYELLGDGALANENVELQVRYVELDGSGNPTGPYVNHYFGNDTTLKIAAKQTNPFSKQLDIAFYDPATFTVPELSKALQFSRANKHYGQLDGTPPLEPGWAADGVVQELSAVGVVRIRASHPNNPWFGRYASTKGLIIDLRETSPGVSGVVVQWANGSSLTSTVAQGELLSNTPYMLAVTFKRAAAGGGLNRLRIAIDGQVIFELLTPIGIVMPSSGFRWNVIPGNEGGSTSSFGELDHDEFRLFNRELTPDELSALHADGEWISGKATEAGLVLGFHMDQVLGSSTKTTPSFLPSQPSMTLQATSGTPTVINGWVTDTFDNAIKQARYRVQVQRIDNTTTGLQKHSAVRFDHFIAILDDEIAYVGSALLYLRILATDQLSGGPPNVTVVAKGKRTCPIWDGVNPDAPTVSQQYSRNPAWVLADHLLDVEEGGGADFDVSTIDWPRFKEWADVCEEQVYDQRGQFTATQLGYAATGVGFAGAVLQVRLPAPRPIHLVVGKTVRLRDIAAGGEDYPTGVFTIRQVVDIDDDSYELWLDWPAGLAAPGTNPFVDADAAVLEGVEPRHSIDIILAERDLKFWDSVNQICSVGRAAPMRIGDKLRPKYDGPRDPVALFTAANIVPGSFRLTATRSEDEPNSLVAEFQDKDLGYERSPVPRDHPSIQAATSTETVRRRIVDLRGMTSRSQVVRELDLRLFVNHDVSLACEFETGQAAAFAEPGDVIAVAHPMPAWAFGGRALDLSEVDALRVDVPVVVGAQNLLASTDQLDDVTHWERTGANPPTLDSSTEPDPAGVEQAAVFTFGAATSILRHSRPLRAGTIYGLSVWGKVMDAGGTANVNLNLDSGDATVALPDDGEWHRIEREGVQAGAADVFDIECPGRQLALAWAQLDRGPITDYVPVGEPSDATISVAVQSADDDSLAFAEVPADAWGAYEATELVPLATPLPAAPGKGWLWALGPAETATLLFQIVNTSLRPTDLRRVVSAVEYKPSVYVDADAYSSLEDTVGSVAGAQLSATLIGPKAMPGLAGPVLVIEEDHEDPDTGHLSKALAVSWRHDPDTAQHVARTHVWLGLVDGGEPELVGTVEGRGTFFRIEGVGRRLEKGGTFRVTVQPETTARVKRGLRRCRSATLTLTGFFPVPREAPTDAYVFPHGDHVTYVAEPPDHFQGKAVEFWRGGPFVGVEIGRVPVGTRTLGPSDDWVSPPWALDGRGPAPLIARLIGPNGAKGDYIKVRNDILPAGFADPPDLAASLEDGPFDTAPAGFSEPPVLLNLQLVAPEPGSSVQRLAFVGGGLIGNYDSTIFDLGSARRAHVGIYIEGKQVAPDLVADLPSVDSPFMRSWTPEGFTDPNHPSYGVVKVEILWAYSTTSADPGTDYLPFRPGTAYLRSCRFRLQFTRPTDDWDVLVDRIAVDIRSVLDDQGPGGAEQETGILFGNLVDTVYVLEHGAGTRDLVCGVVQAGSPYELVSATIEATTPDTVTVTLSAPPGAGALRFVWVAGAADRVAIPFGDGVGTSFSVTHELGSKNVLCAVRQAASPYAFVDASISAAARDSVDVAVALPPGDNALVLVAIGAALNKAAIVFGDSGATIYGIQHGLGSRDIVARVRDLSTGEFVDATIYSTDEDTALVVLSSPPAANGLCLIVTG